MKRSVLSLTLITAVASVTQTTLADVQGDTIAYTCNGCHGTDGVSKGAVPSLKGRPADDQAKMLRYFKADIRPSTIMGRIAKGYSAEELKAVAEYFESLK